MKARSTKSLIVKAAEELILSYGYQGFSYNDIASAIEIRKASIHYHYPAKEDLGVAFIRKYSRMFALWGKRLNEISNKDKLIAFCQMYGELSNNCTRICPIGMVAADYHRMPEKIQTHAQALITQVEDWLEDLIDEGMKSGEFKANLDRTETARQIIHTMSGSLKMARIYKDLSRIESSQNEMIKYVCRENKETSI